MKKKLLVSFLFLAFFSLLNAATYNFDNSMIYSGTFNWAPGDIVNINSDATFDTAIVSGSGTAAAPLNIYIAPGASLIIRNSSSLSLTGAAPNNVIIRRLGATGIHFSLNIRASSSARLTNVEIREASNGINVYSDDVVIDRVYFNQPDQYGVYSNGASPRITRCRFTNSPSRTIYSILFTYTATPTKLPEVFANELVRGTRTGSNAHISIQMPNPAAPLKFYFEGNFFSGGPSYYLLPLMTNVSYDDYPRLNSSPYTGTNLKSYFTLDGGAGAVGQINGPFYIFSDDNYNIQTADISVASGASLLMGVSRNSTAAVSYYGNSNLYFNGLYNLNITNGATFQSRGTTTRPNVIRAVGGGTGKGLWGQIYLSNNSTDRFDYTSIQNATTGLSIQTTPASIQFNSVSVNYNTYGISTNANLTLSNLYMGGNTNAFRITGGTPLIRNNLIYGDATSNTAFNFTGGTFPAGNIRGNTLNNTIDVYANSSGVGTTVYLEQNYWSVNPPVTTNFSGSDVIDYEPWRNATGGNASLRPTADLVVPINGASLASQPQRLTLNVQEIGMYNDSPITYELQLDTSPAFTAPTLFTAPSQRHWTNISANVSAYPFALGTTYYWRARARSIADGLGFGSWSPSWNFSIAKPKLMLQLTADKTNASAGEQVRYQVQFTAVTSTNIANATIVSCLPDDVYFNGNLTLTGFAFAYGPVNVMAWEDINATTLVASVNVGSFTGTVNLNNSYPSWVTALNNHRVRRIDVFLSGNLNNGNTGYVRYETIVK